MTPPLAPTLPPWPEPPGKIKRRDTTMYHVAKYHQALAAAWEARARLAVEALRHIEQYSAGQHGITAAKALLTIGPLPDLPTAEKGE